MPLLEAQAGLELGLHDTVVLTTGEKVGNPRFFHADKKRLTNAQRRLAQKQLGPRNRDKVRRKVVHIYACIARRRDFLHQLSTRIPHELQTVCIESLHVKAMMKRLTLVQAMHDVDWGAFVRLVEYKAAWHEQKLVIIDRWYPSSKRCHTCGQVLDSLSLDLKHWTCPACGVVHDRDVNAAQNRFAWDARWQPLERG